MQYLLVPRSDKSWNETLEESFADQVGESIVLRTPLQRIALTASCHAWLLSQLNALDKVNVMCDTSYVAAKNIQAWMRSAGILDGGTATTPNAEVLMAAHCDALWISPYENSSLGNIANLPVPIIYSAEYMENSPLGRAEWMRFYGRLVGKEIEADTLFAQVERCYLGGVSYSASKQQGTSSKTKKAKLMAELPYGATWYVPGGCSTSAQLYTDAGYQYAWSNDEHAGSLSLSKEAVLAKAQDCDIWLFKYNDPTKDWNLADFKRQQAIYSQFKATQEGNIWGCNTATSDFFEVTPFRPDTLLISLINQDGAFYKQLK